MSSVFLDNVIVFGRLLRAAGLDVHLGRVLDTAEALQHVDVGARDEVYHACRALLVHRHEELPIFDRAFDLFWQPPRTGGVRTHRGAGASPPGPEERAASRGRSVLADARADDTLAGEVGTGAWSTARGLAAKDFALFSIDELRAARAAINRLVWTPGVRRSRRWVRGGGSSVDLRRALANSRRTGGDILVLPRRTRRVHARPLILLCDVSGSMERYTRMLLYFAHAMARRTRHTEAFVFSTSLTRITRQLRARSVDDAVTAASGAVADWSGGTRIGEALRQFLQQWGRRVLHRGPVVLLVSDGWDRGDPDLLRRQVARLQRSCDRLVWLNPLIGTAGFEPLTRGLRAALPFVDDFLPVRTLNDLRDLAAHLNTLAPGGRRRPWRR